MTQALEHAGIRSLGGIIMIAFGALWLLGWEIDTFGPDLRIIGVIAGFALVGCAYGYRDFKRRPPIPMTPELALRNRRLRGMLKWVNILQWSAILAVGALLTLIKQERWFEASIILIVGLHFLPLATALKIKTYYGTGIGLVLVAIVYPFVSAQGPDSSAGALGTGLILWLTAIVIFAFNSSNPVTRSVV